MKKNYNFQFIFCLLLFLFVIVFIFNINGVELFNYKISFIPKELFNKKNKPVFSNNTPEKKDSKIIPDFDTSKLIVYSPKSDQEIEAWLDSLVNNYKNDSTLSNLKESPYLFNIPNKGVYPLDTFFESLYKSDTSKSLYRIAHYGDSQIEGDRMTYELRSWFKTKFHNGGVGYVPIKDITDDVGYIRKSDNSWNRYTVFTNHIKGFAYGQGGSSYRYAPSDKA